ncbi:unnamed protein product [Effrenium voratum]|uniref:Peptidase S74 domain-containing protein n=1 Tax=Effrenium voratum TaxID=2562239 RepID=A0AA36JAI6_9DINO|nr:unnamed protein product [Effrenium voratum]
MPLSQAFQFVQVGKAEVDCAEVSEQRVEAKHVRFGFIADEMEQVLPQVVREVPTAQGPRKSIVYTDLIAVLCAVVRDFGTEVDAVKRRVALAEAALDNLDEKEPMWT